MNASKVRMPRDENKLSIIDSEGTELNSPAAVKKCPHLK